MNIGEKIKAEREARKLTQPELADLCGWGHNQGRISHYETGRRTPTIKDLMTLEAALGLGPGELLRASGSREAPRPFKQSADTLGALLAGVPDDEFENMALELASTLEPRDRLRLAAAILQSVSSEIE